MKLVCISDTHGDHEQLVLPKGDVLVHAGDVTGHGTREETQAFMIWLGAQDFEHKVCIAGNHDTFMEDEAEQAAAFAESSSVLLLNDSGCQLDGIHFWGSPITPRFYDWSFMRDPGAPIEAHWNLIPKNTDVLITHGPAHGILDQVYRAPGLMEHTGCPSLLARIQSVMPSLHVFGHIHEGYGAQLFGETACYNVSSMNEHYRISNPATQLVVARNKKGDLS